MQERPDNPLRLLRLESSIMKFVLASSNPGKVREIRKVLERPNSEIVGQGEFGIQDAIENGNSFRANALIKARHASKHCSLPAIADDSGLCVDFLGGAPGICSARYAGENATDQQNIDKLLAELQGVPAPERTARFQCTLAMVMDADDPHPVIFRGIWSGRIAQSPAGHNGFGYDPVFYIPAMNCTAAELNMDTKNRISHRARALQKLLALLL